jgi:hypothetical protein
MKIILKVLYAAVLLAMLFSASIASAVYCNRPTMAARHSVS